MHLNFEILVLNILKYFIENKFIMIYKFILKLLRNQYFTYPLWTKIISRHRLSKFIKINKNIYY